MRKPKITIKIQEAKPEDAMKGLLESLSNLTSLDGLTADEAKDILDGIALNKKHKIFVAKNEKGAVVGTATVLLEQKLIHKGCVVAHIEDVAVRKGFEGKGIGSALVMHSVAYAKKKGCYRVILDSLVGAVGFYEKLGFKKHGVDMRIELHKK